ncbi:MAG: hypothetical protein PUG97_02345 [bacterium]|nr:hypothetical protein [bacterium]
MKKLLILFLSTLACAGLCSCGTKKMDLGSDKLNNITDKASEDKGTTEGTRQTDFHV